MKPIWRFRLRRTFFGLNDEYMKGVYEQFFFLKYHGGWSFSEAYNLPVGLRMWFVDRLITQLKREKEAVDGATSGAGSGNTQELTAQNQPPPPAFMQRQ